MRCHYEILDVDLKATEEEIKKSYRKLALQWHPDKNPDNIEECTKYFAIIQQAYDVLMDPQERAWYDKHRDQILKGGLDEHYEDNSLNLFAYFSSTCYCGYGDDEKGFYAVYRRVFETLTAEDAEFLKDQEKVREVPQFGTSTSSYDEIVGPFYGYWQSYCTSKSYAWLDKYDIVQAPNRKVLRAMEKENKKIRDAAKKERNDEVRTLIDFVRKRDKRVQAYRKLLEEQRIEQMKKVEAQRMAQKLQNMKYQYLQFFYVRLEQHLFDERTVSEYKDAHWHDSENREEELKVIEQQLDKVYGADSDDSAADGTLEKQAAANDDDDSYDEDDDNANLYCAACEKAFKTSKAYANHERSKKHKDNVLTLKTHMAAEELNLLGLQHDNDDVSLPRAASSSTKKSKKAKKKSKMDSDESDYDADHQQQQNQSTGSGGSEDLTKVLQRRISEDVSEVHNKFERIRERRESGGVDELVFCSICNEKFLSRNKLFAHIRDTNHAALKNVPGSSSKSGDNKKKKKK